MAKKIADNLLRSLTASQVRVGLIQWWLSHHISARNHLSEDSETSRLLETGDDHSSGLVKAALDREAVKPSIKNTEAVFERLIDTARRKKQGAIYTPDHIIDYLISEAYQKRPGRACVILDPACGSGGFLARAAIYIAKHRNLSFSEALYRHVVGIDIDPEAIRHARLLLEIHAASRGERLDSSKLRLYQMDTLLTPPHTLLRRIGVPDGVNILATNPPYVKLQSLDEDYRDALAAKYPEVSRYNFSLAMMFLVAGMRLLSEDGCLAYITQNNLFTSLAGEPIRDLLQHTRCVRRIIDFGHHRVFSGVLAYTCLLFADRSQHDTIEYERIEHDVDLPILKAIRFGDVPVDALKPKKWRLAKPIHMENLTRIEQCGDPLGEIADIRVGFATLKDKVFFARACGDTGVATHPETGQAFDIELAITRPAIRVSDIHKDGQLDSVSRLIIFPYTFSRGKYHSICEDHLRQRFPKCAAYLDVCRPLLELRDKGKKPYEAWYAWGRTQGREAPGPKLLTKTFCTRPGFFYDPTDRLFCNGYSVSLRPQTDKLFGPRLELLALKRVLESRIMHYYAKLTSFQIDGNFQCYQKNFIERFGVPHLSIEQEQTLLEADNHTLDRMLCVAYRIDPGQMDEIVGPVIEPRSLICAGSGIR